MKIGKYVLILHGLLDHRVEALYSSEMLGTVYWKTAKHIRGLTYPLALL